MADSFNPSLADPISQVRQMIGDTDLATVQVPDLTIQAYLDQGLSTIATAATLAGDLSAKYTRLADTTIDHQQTKYSDIAKNFLALSNRLWARAASSPVEASDGYSEGSVIVTGHSACEPPFIRGAGSGSGWCP